MMNRYNSIVASIRNHHHVADVRHSRLARNANQFARKLQVRVESRPFFSAQHLCLLCFTFAVLKFFVFFQINFDRHSVETVVVVVDRGFEELIDCWPVAFTTEEEEWTAIWRKDSDARPAPSLQLKKLNILSVQNNFNFFFILK